MATLPLCGITTNISKKYFRPGGMAQSEPSETPWSQTTPHQVSIPPVAWHNALQLLFHRFLWLCLSPIVNEHSGVGANCDHMSEWVHWVHVCTYIAMGDAAKIPPRVPSTCVQNEILSLLCIHVIPNRQIYVAMDNPSLVQSVSCLNTSSYLWNYMRAADNVSHAGNLQSNRCRCLSHLYKFRDRIQVTRVFRYCGELQG